MGSVTGSRSMNEQVAIMSLAGQYKVISVDDDMDRIFELMKVPAERLERVKMAPITISESGGKWKFERPGNVTECEIGVPFVEHRGPKSFNMIMTKEGDKFV